MDNILIQKSILLVGKVIEIKGRIVFINVNRNKNSSYLLFDGQIIKNVSVGNYIKIQKGFLHIIGKIEGERITKHYYDNKVDINRILEVSLIGYIENKKFIGGTKEMPLIGNEAFIVTKEEQEIIHNLVSKTEQSITIAKSSVDDTNVNLPIDKLFNSHIAIFGNTGSGKSNTLALLYQSYLVEIKHKESHKFVLFDFNGEYIGENCITPEKEVYNLSTQNNKKNNDINKITLAESDLLNIEIFSILSDATEKTQKPFLRNTFNFYKKIYKSDNPSEFFNDILKKKIRAILLMSDKNKAYLLLDYLENILNYDNSIDNIRDDFNFNDTNKYFYLNNEYELLYDNNGEKKAYLGRFQDHIEYIQQLKLYRIADKFNIEETYVEEGKSKYRYHFIDKLIFFVYLNLISQILENRVNNEHIAPLINRIKSRKKDIEKLFEINNDKISFWGKSNFVVINMNEVNLDMKKMIPLLLAKKLYSEHKKENNKKALTIIIDEAHNILSKESFREAEEWKDFRLETFEEIIKEGRKFGVFLTISSQRPNDISETIISQAHNYFIHRLINYKDLNTISSAVSYIDKLTAESIPTLPVGTCIFSGIATQLPLKIEMFELDDDNKPNSKTINLLDIIKN